MEKDNDVIIEQDALEAIVEKSKIERLVRFGDSVKIKAYECKVRTTYAMARVGEVYAQYAPALYDIGKMLF